MQGRRVGLILHGHIRTVLDQHLRGLSLHNRLVGIEFTDVLVVLPTYISPAMNQTVVVLTEDDTRCKGVERDSFWALISAPCSTKIRTPPTSLKDDARCKGVEWVLSCAVTSAPCLINRRTMSALALGLSQLSLAVKLSCTIISALART